MQAPTGGCRIKASKARSKQWDELLQIIDQFKNGAQNEIVLETVMGKFFMNLFVVKKV